MGITVRKKKKYIYLILRWIINELICIVCVEQLWGAPSLVILTGRQRRLASMKPLTMEPRIFALINSLRRAVPKIPDEEEEEEENHRE